MKITNKVIITISLSLIFLTLFMGCSKPNPNNKSELQDDINNIQDQINDIVKENIENKVGEYILPNESDFIWEDTVEGVSITGYIGAEKAVIVPEILGGKSVVGITNGAFNQSGILGIKLPNSMTVVSEKAFYYCTTLIEVYLGDNITVIDAQAFEGCVSLEEISFNSSLQEIGMQAFGYCSLLNSVDFTASVKKIGVGAFCLSGIETVDIPSSVEIIDESAFATCSLLKKVTIDEGVKIIGSEAFAGCENLKDVILPMSVETIGSRVFSQSNNVTITAPSGSVAESYAVENEITFKVL